MKEFAMVKPLTIYQKRLLKYLRGFLSFTLDDGCTAYQVMFCNTASMITLNHLKKQQCETLIKYFKKHAQLKAAYRILIRSNQHAYFVTEGRLTICPCELHKTTENKPAGLDQPIKYLDDMSSSIKLS